MRRVARLYGDDELRVLWLTMRRQELALSVDGVWLRSGRRTADLAWEDIEQIQMSAVGARWLAPRVRIEIFSRDGRTHTVGPFPSAAAERWMRACAQAATEHGELLTAVSGGDGFALRERP